MASLASEIQTWMNDNLPVHIDWNVAQPSAVDPWYLMVITGTDNEKPFLCDSDGGELTLSVEGYGSQRYDTYEQMETIRQQIDAFMRNNVANYKVWNVQTSGTESTGTIENQMNSYTFEIVVSWSL